MTRISEIEPPPQQGRATRPKYDVEKDVEVFSKRVFDVLLVPESSGQTLQGWSITEEEPVKLDDGIWIDWAGRIGSNDHQLPVNSDAIMNACESAGYIDPPVPPHEHNYRPIGNLTAWYVLWNEHPTNPDSLKWDPDWRLIEFVALSRIVHATPAGYDYAARIVFKDSKLQTIIPFSGHPAYVSQEPQDPYYLTPEQWQETAKLVKLWRKIESDGWDRIESALWYREKLAQEYYLEVRWSLLITAIESLTTEWLSKKGSRERFRVGVSKLAAESSVPVSSQDANDAWQRRSSLIHGQGWPGGKAAAPARSDCLYRCFEKLLDKSLRRLIEYSSFRENFKNDKLLTKWLNS